MGKAHKYIAGAIASTAAIIGAISYSRTFKDPPVSHNPIEAQQPARTEAPYSIQPALSHESPKPTADSQHGRGQYSSSLEQIAATPQEVIFSDSLIYRTFFEDFGIYLENTKFQTGRELFQSDFNRSYEQGVDDVLAIINQDPKFRDEMKSKYGIVIDLLSDPKNSSKTIADIASENSYPNPAQTVDAIWKDVEISWGSSRIKGAIPDILAGRELADVQREVLIRMSTDYFRNKGLSPSDKLASNIRDLQQRTRGYMQLNDGRELTDQERETMQKYENILEDIQTEVQSVPTDFSEEKVENKISEHLGKINPLAGLARAARLRQNKE